MPLMSTTIRDDAFGDNVVDFRLVQAFNALNFVGIGLLCFTLIPALVSHAVRRTHTWYSLIGSSLLYCVSCSLLLGHQYGEDPPFGLCLTQTALIYASPIFTTISILSFTITLYLNLANIQTTPFQRRALALIPFGMFLVICAEVVLIGLFDRNVIERDPTHMFCHCRGTRIPIGIDLFIEILSAGIDIVVLVLCGRIIYQRWKNGPIIPTSGSNVPSSAAMYARILFFTAYLTLALSIVAVALLSPMSSNAAWNLSLPTAPIASALIFGTQKDILRAWIGVLRDTSDSLKRTMSRALRRQPSKDTYDVEEEATAGLGNYTK